MTAATTTKNTDYLLQRLAELGISKKQNTFTRLWKQADAEGADKEYTRDYQVFDADDKGNIIIHYFDPNGQPYRWKKEDTKQTRDFVRVRLREPKDDMKYAQAAGSPLFPFFPPELIRKFKNGEEIGTLFLVEGEFKAFKASITGIDTVGLPGIHGFYNADIRSRLHEDIEELIIKCKVRKVCILFDADLLSLKWGADKDLSKRPLSFYASIKAFRESVQHLLDSKPPLNEDETDKAEYCKLELVYFMHIKSKFMNEAKGLDDLLVKYSDRSVEIQEDICQLSSARKYFECKQINDINRDVTGWTFRYLGLQDEQEFYKLYKEFIGALEFKFKRRRYIYDNERQSVVFVRHEDAEKFMRIGPDWVKVIQKANKHGEIEEEIVPWKISEIVRDYKKYPEFLEQVQKYDDFCNEPCFTSNYKRVHHNNFNLCNPITWRPAEGSIQTSIAFLQHIFQGSSNIDLCDQGKVKEERLITGDPFAVALDYLSLLVQQPKHMLPVPILVSKENGTGKSTFLKWLQTVFGANMAILGNEQFKMKFNAHYITKYVIAIDEGFLEVDKKSEKERLKQLVTADSAYLEYKGMNIRKINYYGKLIICSNDADRVMKIDEGESRWFVVKVPVVPSDKKDPDLEIKLKNEVPAFFHYLLTRQIFHPRVDRLWFKPEWFITEQFKVIVSETRSRIDRVFEEWIREQFLTFNQEQLQYSLKWITEQLNDARVSKYKVDSLEIKSFLKGRGYFPSETSKWISIPTRFKTDGTIPDPTRQRPAGSQDDIDWVGFTARPYTFHRSDWVGSQELLGDNVRPVNEAETEKIPF